MASISVIKQKRKLNFGEAFFEWLKDQDVEIGLETEKALRKFSSEIEISKSIEESSNFITDSGPYRKASDLIEEFVKQDSVHAVLENVEISGDDHLLLILSD